MSQSDQYTTSETPQAGDIFAIFLRPTNEDNTSNKENLKEMWDELIMSLKKTSTIN